MIYSSNLGYYSLHWVFAPALLSYAQVSYKKVVFQKYDQISWQQQQQSIGKCAKWPKMHLTVNNWHFFVVRRTEIPKARDINDDFTAYDGKNLNLIYVNNV